MNNIEITEGRINGEVTDERVTVLDTPSLDWEKYRSLMSDEESPTAGDDEFLRVLWEIMKGFVDNAWDVRVIPAFFPEIFDDPSGGDRGEVDSSDEENADE